jgi:hypothetical protein
MQSATLLLGNKSYALGTSKEDKVRRAAHFANGEGELTQDERQIAHDLGIDDTMMEYFRPHMAAFYDALPGCQTDTSLILNKKCEIVYHVLWSALFSAQDLASRELNRRGPMHKTLESTDWMTRDQMVRDLRPSNTDINAIDRIFTLVVQCPPDADDLDSPVIAGNAGVVLPAPAAPAVPGVTTRSQWRAQQQMPLPPVNLGRSAGPAILRPSTPVTANTGLPSMRPPMLSDDPRYVEFVDRIFTLIVDPSIACGP